MILSRAVYSLISRQNITEALHVLGVGVLGLFFLHKRNLFFTLKPEGYSISICTNGWPVGKEEMFFKEQSYTLGCVLFFILYFVG